jgi:N-acetylmuramoyl-L-alanine amidase
MPSPLILLLLLLAALPATAAADAEQAYGRARESYRQLLDSPQRQLHRDRWQKVTDGFLAVHRSYPKHRRAADALYQAGKATQGMYEVSRVRDDARRALDLYDSLARDYPDSTLADDALLLAAGIAERLDDFSGAYQRYAAALARYPRGDMAARARIKFGELASYAPKPEPSAPPAVSAPAPPPVAAASSTPAGSVEMTGIRFWSNPGYTRVVIALNSQAEYSANFLPADERSGLPPRLYVDMAANLAASVPESTDVGDGLLRRIRAGRSDPRTVRVVLDLHSFKDYKVLPLADPFRIVIDIAGDRPLELSAITPEVHTPAAEPKDGIARILEKVPPERPLKVHIPPGAAQAGLRRIVVDAGHGGKDPGAIGPSGVQEKDVTLALARVLAKRLEENLGCEVILTRNSDVFLPLEERTAIANKVGADLFISIHANASTNRSAYGTETYYLNFAKNDKAAAVVARENGTSLKQVGDLELILFDLMANSKINESSRLATEIQKSLVDRLGRHYSDIRDLGVKQGPFYVLLGATMPSVLVEAAFISHKREEALLIDQQYHERTAAAITQGVRNYATALHMIAAQ